MFYNTLFKGLELKLYSITVLRAVSYGEITCQGVDNEKLYSKELMMCFVK